MELNHAVSQQKEVPLQKRTYKMKRRKPCSSLAKLGNILFNFVAKFIVGRVVVAVNRARLILERDVDGAMHLLDQLRVDVISDV